MAPGVPGVGEGEDDQADGVHEVVVGDRVGGAAGFAGGGVPGEENSASMNRPLTYQVPAMEWNIDENGPTSAGVVGRR